MVKQVREVINLNIQYKYSLLAINQQQERLYQNHAMSNMVEYKVHLLPLPRRSKDCCVIVNMINLANIAKCMTYQLCMVISGNKEKCGIISTITLINII